MSGISKAKFVNAGELCGPDLAGQRHTSALRRSLESVGTKPESYGMIALIIGTNRPGSNSRKIARHIEEIYAALGKEIAVVDLAALPPEIFAPTSYATKPVAFEPFQTAVCRAAGLHVVTPEYNGGIPGVLKYFIDMLKLPESVVHKPVCFVGLSAGQWGALRPVEQLQAIFTYEGAYVYCERVFIPNVLDALDEFGRLKDGAMVDRLRAQVRGFIEFVEHLEQAKFGR